MSSESKDGCADVRIAMLYESETWSFTEEDLTRLERNGARTVRWMCNVRPDDKTSVEELRTWLKLNSM